MAADFEADVDRRRGLDELEGGVGGDLRGGEPREPELTLDALVPAAVAQPEPGRPELEGVVAAPALDRAVAGVEVVVVGLEEVVGGLVEAAR